MSKLLTLSVLQQGTLLNQSEAPDAAPTGLALTVVDRTDIKLDWTDNATNEDGYKIERSADGENFTVIGTVAADVETYTDEDLDELTKYYYRVRAYKGDEYSAYTDIENKTTGSPAFIITVKTDNAGTSNDNQFTIPIIGTGYNYSVVTSEQSLSGQTGDCTLTWTNPGTYQVKIYATTGFPRIYFNNTGDKLKLLFIDNWGDIVWTSMQNAFSGCANMNGRWNDAPDLSADDFNCSSMFISTILNYPLTGWDTSKVINMNSMFFGTPFNQPVGHLDVSNVTNMNSMFRNSTFNQSFDGWNTVKNTILYRFLLGNSVFKQSLGHLNIGLCTNFGAMLEAEINETGTTTNYDHTLVSWAAQTVKASQTVDFKTSKYGQGKVDEGTTDGTTAYKLVDSSQNFLTTVTVGDVIHNTTDGTYARVTAIDSDTQLSLDNDIMVSGEAYVVQHSDAAKARASLILDDGWVITDGGAA